ncbi:hypothetical protein GPA19_13455 [Azoarcus indigens]|uniref:Uncharacterized protein n=1 Tax=Azoarcus indigens TaxID=29545 RepID=A0A4R6EEI8_9RHOO|nr:hypothetical protein [Azoarcus indigens]NMG65952.1 hypothetical protein [Azoarcus indigens]TDN55899.1 hypothetical protein C7389_103237 [Azoarcus indigens]
MRPTLSLLACSAFLSPLLPAHAAGAPPFVCGDSVVHATTAQARGDVWLQDFVVTLERGGERRVLRFKPENDFLRLHCVAHGGRGYLVVDHSCGGSGCADHNYGVVDLADFSEPLQPTERYRGNEAAARRLLEGDLPASLDCRDTAGASLCLQVEDELQ